MPRRRRPVVEGAVYHLYNRFARGEAIVAAELSSSDAAFAERYEALDAQMTARGDGRPRERCQRCWVAPDPVPGPGEASPLPGTHRAPVNRGLPRGTAP